MIEYDEYSRYMKDEYTLKYRDTWFLHNYCTNEWQVEHEIEEMEELFYCVLQSTDEECVNEYDESRDVMLAKIANDLDALHDELDEYDTTYQHEKYKMLMEIR